MWSIGFSASTSFVRLVLSEIADAQLRPAADFMAGERGKAVGQQFRQCRLAVAVGAQQRNPIVHIHRQRHVPQHRRAVIADCDTV